MNISNRATENSAIALQMDRGKEKFEGGEEGHSHVMLQLRWIFTLMEKQALTLFYQLCPTDQVYTHSHVPCNFENSIYFQYHE